MMVNSPNNPILLVDDEAIVLVALKETLLCEGYAVVSTHNPLLALTYLHQRKFAVILVDYRMPEMSGLTFLIEANKIQPHASRILITGGAPTILKTLDKGAVFRFLPKPWTREELFSAVKHGMERHKNLEAIQ